MFDKTAMRKALFGLAFASLGLTAGAASAQDPLPEAASDPDAQLEAAPAATTSLIERHTGPTPGVILQGVTVQPGATMLYLSGQLAAPIDPAATGAKQPADVTMADYGDTKTQTVSTLHKIEALLAEHGYTMSDVIKMTAFVAGDPAMEGRMDFGGFNEGFREFFGTAANPNTLARSTVQVAALAAPQFLVELEVVAAK